MGFGGDSRGYVASRLDLSAFAGQTIVPRFTMNRDGFAALFKIGWYVDDITVYTCTPGVLPPINNITLPSISGTPVFGQVLTASPGTWSEAGTTFAYQWRRGGTDIPGATASTYQAGAADLGMQLSVRVTASKTTFADGIATSAATGAVQPAALSVGAPTIKGKARVGKTLTALPGSWGPTPLTLSYQWLRNGAPITGATGTAYKLKKKDKGKKISVRVTGTKPGFTTASATSPPTKKIKPKN
jgi:hypothetical protein